MCAGTSLGESAHQPYAVVGYSPRVLEERTGAQRDAGILPKSLGFVAGGSDNSSSTYCVPDTGLGDSLVRASGSPKQPSN